MCKCNLCFFYFVILCCGAAYCYNVETINFNRYTRPENIMFGFSVAAHKERGYNWILVGAPEAQTNQPGVQRGGAVYKCSAQWNDTCNQVAFDKSGDNIRDGLRIDQKSKQWFGATLHSAGTDGPVVACAPRYVWYPAKRTRRDPVGTCYVARNEFTDIGEYSPCRTSKWGYHRQGSCQAGFSAAISKDGKRLFVGAPGSWYWQGQMYSIDANAKFRFTPGNYRGVFGSGQVIQQSLENRPAVIQTRESPEIDDVSYMGYSMAVGDFTGEGVQGSAVGMPRGNELLGKVVIYTWNLTNFRNISGLQLGAYFGYAVASCDVDGDRRDDLIIGAPLHTEPNNEEKYEVGRVYIVYQQSAEGSYRRLEQLDGFNSKSRFGLSVASLGDINLDGYGDFAVGAPYDGPSGNGAVYIFHGSKAGVKKHTQVIYSEDVSRFPTVKTFGFSLSGTVDLDDNDYPDTVVGAYLSNTVFYFRSRPVVKIEGTASFLIDGPKDIDLEKKNCTVGNRVPVSCTTLKTCFKFHGQGVPRDIRLELQYALDVQKPRAARMYFLNLPKQYVINETISLRKGDNYVCWQKMVYIRDDIKDKLTPLEAEVRYSMIQKRHAQYTNELLPILDLSTPPVKQDTISIHKNCGTDNICIPNLSMRIKPNVQRYLLGSNEKLELDVIVENSGEDSFETTFDVHLPEGVDFNKAIETDKNEVIISCSESHDENNTVSCEIGNPLPAKKIVHFKLDFKPYHKEGMKSSYDFYMFVNSTNPENKDTMRDNSMSLKLPVWVDAKLELGGTSRYAEVHYNKSYYTAKTIKRESDIGPQVIHTYTIRNNGPSLINEAEMLFIWPYATEGGEDLMYLLEQPHILGDVTCERADANYKGYELDYRQKSIWETLEIDVSRSEYKASISGKKSGGVIVHEGLITKGVSAETLEKTDVEEEEEDLEDITGGDASQHLAHRHEMQQKKTDAGGQAVLVSQDTGGGSTVQTVETRTYWNSTGEGPVVTTTYTKNTTSVYNAPNNNNNPSFGVERSESKSGGTHGKKYHGGAKHHIIYSSSNQDLQQGNTLNRVGGGTSSGAQAGGGEDLSVSGHQQGQQVHSYGGQQTGVHMYSSEDFTPDLPDEGDAGGYYDQNTLSGNRHGEHWQTGHSGRDHSTSRQRNTSESDFAQHGLGSFAAGSGFRVGGVELGAVGNNANVDESVSKQANRQFEVSGQGRYDPDLGRVVYDDHQGGGVHRKIIYSSGGSKPQGSRYYQSGPQWQAGETHYSSETSYDQNYPAARDNVPTDKPDLHNRFVGRRKREIIERNDINIEDVMKCKATKCKYFKCRTGPMKKDQDAIIALRSRINVHTLQNITSSQSISLSSMMLARISKVPYIGTTLQKDIYSHEIFTTIPAPEADSKPDIVPLWVVILSAVAGAIILLLLIFLLYKCGFFKRNRPSDAPERQPLNRNGHYHSGDEAL